MNLWGHVGVSQIQNSWVQILVSKLSGIKRALLYCSIVLLYFSTKIIQIVLIFFQNFNVTYIYMRKYTY